jgi:ABC-type antimicrobial peptide transport system permease subunit
VTWAALVWRNLLRRPARTALTATGVGLGVALIGAVYPTWRAISLEPIDALRRE